MGAEEGVGEVRLGGVEAGSDPVGGVLVAGAVAEVGHEAGGRVADVQGDGERAGALDDGAERLGDGVEVVGLGRLREVDDGLREVHVALGVAQEVARLVRGDGKGQRVGVRHADVLARHAHEAARDVQRVLAAHNHAEQPVQARVHITPAHTLVKCRDLFGEGLVDCCEKAH